MVVEKLLMEVHMVNEKDDGRLSKVMPYSWTCLDTVAFFWSSCRKPPFHKVCNDVYDFHIG